MHQVERGLTADQAPFDGSDGAQVDLVDLDLVRPVPVRQFPGRTDQAPHGVPGLKEAWYQAPADIPGSAGYCDALGCQEGGCYSGVRKPQGHRSAHFPQA